MADANPFSIPTQIFLRFDDLIANAITDGPAPLIVAPNAPADNAFFLILEKPGIICFLAGSTISSMTASPILLESLVKNPKIIAAASCWFLIFTMCSIFFGITLLETLVFFSGTFSFGIATHNTRSFGGSICITSSGFVLTITNPPSTDAATLS